MKCEKDLNYDGGDCAIVARSAVTKRLSRSPVGCTRQIDRGRKNFTYCIEEYHCMLIVKLYQILLPMEWIFIDPSMSKGYAFEFWIFGLDAMCSSKG